MGIGLLAAALVGGQIISGHQQKKAAKRATRASVTSAQQQIEAQKEALQQYRAATEPFRFGGQQAINPLLSALGLGSIALPQQPTFSLLSQAQQAQVDERLARLDELIVKRDKLKAKLMT